MGIASARIQAWRENPCQFVHDVFGVELDAWQVETLKALGGEYNPRRRVAMKACTGPGKSAVLAWIGWHRLACFARKGSHPKGVALSGEGRENLRDNLWAELSKWQSRSEFLKSAFTWTRERISANQNAETWFLSARSYAKDADPEAIGRSLSGLHCEFPFILLDEIGDMPIVVGQKSSQIFTGGVVDGLIAAAGNPTSTTGLLYHVATQEREMWSVVTITADPDDPRRTPRVDAEHARQMILTHGRDNPWVMSTILGLFPPQGFNALLGVDEVETAMRRVPRYEDYAYSQRRLGVDAARFGDDRTVIFPRQGLNAAKPKPIELRGLRTNEIAARVQAARSRWAQNGTHDIIELVDDTGGYGAGVVDSLIQSGRAPHAVNFASRAIDSQFKNRRAEMWWNMAEWIKRGGALPNMPQLVRELTSMTYTHQNGQILMEPKEKVKERLGFSPDLADALALTFAIPDQPATLTVNGLVVSTTGTHKYDYDPFADDRL